MLFFSASPRYRWDVTSMRGRTRRRISFAFSEDPCVFVPLDLSISGTLTPLLLARTPGDNSARPSWAAGTLLSRTHTVSMGKCSVTFCVFVTATRKQFVHPVPNKNLLRMFRGYRHALQLPTTGSSLNLTLERWQAIATNWRSGTRSEGDGCGGSHDRKRARRY